MQKTVVKKVRLTEQEAKTLRRIAARRKVSESEVLREGLTSEAVLEDRRRNALGLVRFLTGEEPEKVRWEGKP